MIKVILPENIPKQFWHLLFFFDIFIRNPDLI